MSCHRFATVALVMLGCALGPLRQAMVASPDNPAGEGTVSAAAGRNGNTDVELRVKHLADPARMAADASVYVVWITPRHGNPQNVGAMELADDRGSEFNASTPHRTFSLMITPEPGPRMAKPTHPPVFTAEVSREE